MDRPSDNIKRPVFIDFPPNYYQRASRRFQVEKVSHPDLALIENVFASPQYDCLFSIAGERIESSKRVNLPADLAPVHMKERVSNRSDAKFEPPSIAIPSDYEVVEEPVLFLGSIWPHYGHFLTDSMARLWSLDHALAGMPAVWLTQHYDMRGALPFIETVLRTNVGPARPTMQIKRPTLFRSLLAPSASIQHTYRIYDCHQTAHLRTAEATIQSSSSDVPRKTYLSRSGLDSSLRQSGDEMKIEERLRREGFTIVYPERLSFEEQILIFNRSDWIVGTIGSAFHTSLFSRRDYHGRFAVLCWEKVNPRYLMIDAIKEYAPTYISCMKIDSLKENGRVEKTSIDYDRALNHLSEIGAFKN